MGFEQFCFGSHALQYKLQLNKITTGMKKMRHNSHRLRITLLAGASVVALAAAAPNADAADMAKPAIKKAPPPAAIVKERWTWWIEGGAFNSAGDDVNFAGPLRLKPKWGGEGAAGFDWKPATFQAWHLSGQFRYGAATKNPRFPVTAAGTVGGTTFAGTPTNNEKIRDDH